MPEEAEERAEVAACPECDTAQLQRRSSSYAGPESEQEEPYYCGGCGSYVEEPVYRENRAVGGPAVSGLAAELLEADPEEASR
jgi:hypothetical protein